MISHIKYFTPIIKVAKALDSANIPFEFHSAFDGAQLRFPWSAGDIVCHNFSRGANAGYVESYQFPWDNDDTSMLTTDEAIEKISNYYCEIYP